MSTQVTLSRRALLGFLRKKEEPVRPPEPAPAPVSAGAGAASGDGFSLEAFYAARARPAAATETASRMTVRVRPQLCLAWQGSFCSTCSERCPVEGAIALELGRPRVVEPRCTGCGLCIQVCPAPLNAFELLPSSQQVSVP
ncbi:hypothetical protein F0U61_16160 [Archangium violaceum]|uniref:4Fe-4S dicluster domain-containing protein n=1 Tax=Archangium violaceum TaxID=83451 RepID=UPI002B29A75C|nr:hypothetical protein F0U61_16160 [Archangium violaceum]